MAVLFVALSLVSCARLTEAPLPVETSPTPTATPIISPTPTYNACESEVESLKSEIDSLRERLKNDEPCVCYYDEDFL